jgi:hypothetical protein
VTRPNWGIEVAVNVSTHAAPGLEPTGERTARFSSGFDCSTRFCFLSVSVCAICGSPGTLQSSNLKLVDPAEVESRSLGPITCLDFEIGVKEEQVLTREDVEGARSDSDDAFFAIGNWRAVEA